MTFKDLQELVMTQIGYDVEDLADYATQIKQYLNEGYYKLHEKYDGYNPDAELSADADEPDLPDRSHGALADYATYRMYMTGNAQKQNRGAPFLAQYREMANDLGRSREEYSPTFTNLYSR